MANRRNLEAADRSLRDLQRLTLQFKKVVALCMRDFCHIFLAIQEAEKSQIASASFRRPQLYALFRCFHLEETMRLQAFCKDLHAIPDVLQL